MQQNLNPQSLIKHTVSWWGQPHQIHQKNPLRYPFVLESQMLHGEIGRYHIVFALPQQCLCLDAQEKLFLDGKEQTHNDFLQQLNHLWQQHALGRVCESEEERTVFAGGWFLYLSYELAGQIEAKLKLPKASSQLPMAMAVRIPAAIIMDPQNQSCHLIAEDPSMISIMLDDIGAISECPREELDEFQVSLHEEDPRQYLQSIETVQNYIRQGDVFQANMSRQWTLTQQKDFDALQVYMRLKKYNPAPFSALVKWQDTYLLSCSPERLLQVEKNRIETRPIAGTRPRHQDAEEDVRLKRSLRLNQKEQAEHIMLIDLERNDLGRICRSGSIRVSDLMRVESYATVHHIVSTIEGQLKEGIQPGDVIRAIFPGGTITGCPKVRCMEIIAELEQQGRGAYTGSLGYLNHDGSMDLNILIRSLELKGNKIQFRTGGGIVYDSVGEKELAETRHKAKGILGALGLHHA